jgi:hypothetical protein
MSRIDVGGNRAGTQTGYTAYGYSGQNRVLVEGINTTEGTSGAGFYFDYGSFEEVFLGTIGQGSEMPTPGVQSQFLGKSGGNRFQGEIYQDYENNSLQSDNIAANLPSRFAYSAANTNGIRDHSNELQKYHDFNLNVGGPIKKDKVWWYFSHRYQKNGVGQPNFVGAFAGTSFETTLWNPSGKATYQINQNNKLIGYYQWGQKIQPNRLPYSTVNYTSADSTFRQNSGSWVYKGEWNGTLSNNLYAEARYGVFGYYFPLVANTDTALPEILDTSAAYIQNGDQKEQTDRQRRQLTGAATYFKDGWGGTHNLKVGGELLLETGWFGYTQDSSGNILESFSNGKPQQIQFYFPTATRVGSLGDGPNGNLLSVSKVTTVDAFVSDQYAIGRATLNLGVRFDHYRVWTPPQKQLAGTSGPISIPAQSFPETTYVVWNAFAPRIGLSYDVQGNGKTVVKLNYGLFRFNPGVGVADNGNPNQSAKSVTYSWTPANCNYCDYQPGQEGQQIANALAGNITVDPNMKEPYSNQYTAYLERQLTEGVGARVGFVLFKVNNQVQTIQSLRPASAYTVPFTVTNAITGAPMTEYGVPNNLISGCGSTTVVGPNCSYPTAQLVTSVPNNGTYKTFEFSVNKRQSRNFTLSGGFGYSWQHDFPLSYPNTPNSPADYNFTSYSFKANGTYTARWGILLSALYRFQAGANYAARQAVSAPTSCACTFSAAGSSLTNRNVFATPFNAYRQDNISVIDLRGEKTVGLKGTVKVRLFVDGFNLLNKYAAETISVTTGSAFQQPTAILGPRTGRIGFRFMW